MAGARTVRFVVKPLVFAAALTPLGLLAHGAAFGGLGPNPIEAITHGTGDWTLRFLLITLALTPLRVLTGWNGFARFRRMLGLFAFFYAALHLLTYLWLDQFFAWTDIVRDIAKPAVHHRRHGGVRHPGAARGHVDGGHDSAAREDAAWKRLHRLVYLSAIAAVVHYWWLVKADVSRPRAYAIAFAVVLAARLYVGVGDRDGTTSPPRLPSFDFSQPMIAGSSDRKMTAPTTRWRFFWSVSCPTARPRK